MAKKKWRVDFMSAQSITINPDEIHFDFIRASGPGGQNVNKVSTAVQLRFNIRKSRSLEPEIRERLIRLARKRVTSSGEIIIVAKRFRTQQRNREDAVQRLLKLIEKASIPPRVRRRSQPSTRSKLRRLEDKKRRSDLKKLRSQVPADE
jgi:ribosome-associated protein